MSTAAAGSIFRTTKKLLRAKATQKNIKKVVYKEELDSEPEPEEKYSAEEIEEETEIKKKTKKNREKRKNNIFDYINNNAKRHKQ